MITVTYEAYCLAHKHWNEFHNREMAPFADREYDTFIGMQHMRAQWGFGGREGGLVEVIDEEVARKINLLAGPHWYAVLKAYEAKNA